MESESEIGDSSVPVRLGLLVTAIPANGARALWHRGHRAAQPVAEQFDGSGRVTWAPPN